MRGPPRTSNVEGDAPVTPSALAVAVEPVEVDAEAMMVARDPRQLLEGKYGIDDSFDDDVHDAIADMPREVCWVCPSGLLQVLSRRPICQVR